MAPRYPRYERQARGSAQLRGPGQIDFAASRESEHNAQLLGAAADRMFNFATQSVEKQARHQGQRDAAIQPGETLAQFKNRAPQTAYEESAYATAVNISAARISTEARTGMNEAWLDWRKNWQTGDGLTPQDLVATMTGITNGLSDTIAALDPVAGEQVRAKLNMYAESLYLDVSGIFLKEQAKEFAAKSVELLADTSADLQRYARRDLDADTFDVGLGLRLRNYDAEQRTLGRDPDDVASDVVKLRHQAHEDRVRGQYSRLTSIEEQKKYLADFKADENYKKTARGLTSGQIKMLKSEMAGAPAYAAAALKRQAAHVKSVASANFGGLAQGHVPPQADQRTLTNLAEKSGDPEAVADVVLLSEGIKLQATMMRMSANEQSALVASMEAAREAAGGTNPRQAKLINLAAEINTHTFTAMQTDQVTFFNRRASPGDQLSTIFFQDLNPDNEEAVRKLADRVTRINQFSFQMGDFTPIYFSKEERAALKSIFDGQLSPGIKLAAIKALILASGGAGRSIELVKQVADDAGSLVVAGAVALGGNDRAARDIFSGLAAVESGGQVEASDGGGSFTNLHKQKIFDAVLATGESGGYLLNESNMGTIKTAANAMFQGMLQRSADARENAAEWYERAVQQALGADYVGDVIVSGGVLKGRKVVDREGIFTGDIIYKIHLDTTMPVENFRWLEENWDNLQPEHIPTYAIGLNQGWPKTQKGDDAKIVDLREAIFAPGDKPGWVRLLTPQGDGYQDDFQINLKQVHRLMRVKSK